MNHLMKFEEIKWNKIKTKVSNLFSPEIDKKFREVVSKLNINGVKFEQQEQNNRDYINYKSIINIDVPIDGYEKSILWITKRLNIISISLNTEFKESSIVGKILHGPRVKNIYSHNIKYNHNTKRPYISFKTDFVNINNDIKVDELKKIIVNNINTIINQNWNEVKKDLNKASVLIDEHNRNLEEKNRKGKELVSKSNEISDLLISLEDISKSVKKESKDGFLSFTYEIPGIIVEPTEYSKSSLYRYSTARFTNDVSKFILTDELFDVMDAIKSFKNKVRDEILDSKIKIHFKNNFVTIIFIL
jgi:hypothetical protein